MLCLEKIGDVLDLILNILTFDLVFLAEDEPGLNSLHLRFQQAESIRIRNFEATADINGQLFIGLAEFIASVSIGAVLAEVTLLLLLKVLADLRLIVVVRNVEHLVLHLYRQLLSKRIKSVRD